MHTRLTILRDGSSPAIDPETLALTAIGWLLGDRDRTDRLLALTGMTPDSLRTGLGDRAVLAAVLEFLSSHEPDLLAAADALGVEPRVLASACESLGR
ncbi:MAG TPA: DUF3572 domain-containing protein [Novosphingobium sp.]|nr:DUF3572 domain-containing protein [Novosphingobium sp.]